MNMSDPYEQVVAGMATQQKQQEPADPYEGIVDQMAGDQRGQAALSVGLASSNNPDQAAQYAQIAKQLHTTPQAVAAFPDDFKRFVATSQAREAFGQAPALGNYVGQHPNVAAVMHDDLANAATLEQMSGPVMKAWQPSIGQRITQWWDGLFNLPARRRARAANQIAAQDAGMTPGQERDAVGGISEMPGQAASKFLHTASFGLIPDVAGTPTTTGGDVGDIGGQLAGFFAGPMKAADWALGKVGLTKLLTAPEGASFLRAATTTAARQAATFGLAGALANTGEALNSPTLGSALHKEADAAGQNALMGGVFGATSHMFPDQTIAHFVGRFLTAQAALDAAQGRTPGVAEVNDLAHGTTDQRLQAGVNLLMNAIMSAHGAGRVSGGWVRDAARASLAEEDHAALSALSDTAAASKWRGREGESFKEFLGYVGPDADLYVSGDSFAQAMAHEGITADELRQKLPGVAEQLPGAINSESDVRIPLTDYMTHIAGTPMDARLRPEVKTDPEAMSFAEAQAFRQAKAQFSDAIDHEVQQGGESEAWRQGARNVFDQVRSQLEASGRVGRDAAKTQALYASHFYTVLAHRLGIAPEEAFEKWGASVTGGEGAGPGLGQEPSGNPDELPDEFGIDARELTGDEYDAALQLFRTLKASRSALQTEGLDGRTVAGTEPDQTWPGATVIGAKSGRAALVYRGSDVPLVPEHFEREALGYNTGYNASGLGVWFTANPDEAASYGGHVEPFYLDIRNPKVYTTTSGDDLPNFNSVDEAHAFREKLRAAGHDGVVIDLRDIGENFHAVAFNPDQVIRPEKGFYQTKGQPTADEARGMYYPDSRTIALLKDADLSTYFHEMGHAALDIYSKLATTDDAPEGVKDDVDKLMQWFGVKGETPAERLASWHALGTDGQRDYHEQFAKGMEQYLMDGKAPSHALRPLFAKVRQWLLRVYETLRHGLGVELTPEVRGVMDRMLATEDEIDAAQKARGYFDMPKPEGVDEGEWQKYKALGQEATDEAISQMGARSVKDMQWISNAKGKAMRELQKRAANLRAGVREEAAKEADAMPVYRAERWFTKGEMTTPEGDEVAVDQDAKSGAKLNTDAVRALYPEGIPKQLHGMTSPDGMDPELAAGMFGYPSAGSMLDDLVNREPRQSVVQGLTDRYMLERHGDLATPDAVERAAEEAIHNQARARQMATGLKVLTKSPLSRRLLEKGARDVAEETVSRQKVGDVNPRPYAAAEAKSLKEVLEAAPKDPQRAILAQRAALLNNQLYKAASDAQRDIEKAPQYFKKFGKKSIRAKLDPDVLEQVDDLLDRFDFRKYPTGAPDKKVVQLQQWMESQKAVGYTPLENPDMLNPAVRMPYREMTVEQLRGLVDTVKSMEDIARSRRKVTVDGQQMELQAVVNDLAAKMAERGDRFTDAQLAEGKRRGVDPLWRVGLDRMAGALRSAQSRAKIPHFRANQFDVHQVMGPFHRYVFEPVFGANYRYVDMLQEVSKAFAEGAKSLGADWQKSLTEVVDNHRLMDNALEEPQKRRLTRGDLIGIALHVGNESNFDKLAKGMKWDPTDIWDALHDNMRAEDWEAAKLIGHVAGMHWDDEVAMNKRLGNTTPEKIEPRPFMTKFGEMPGWYAPISYDPVRSKLAVRQQDAKAVNPVDGLFGKNYYRADTTTNGSLNARIAGYYDFVNLDPKATEANIRQGLRDLAYREALVDTHKIVAHSDFRRQFLRSYGHEEYKAMLDWLGKMVNMETPEDERSNAYVQFSRTARRAVVANGIAFRISTLLKHGLSAGAKSVGYFAGGGEKYFMGRAKAIGLDHKAQVVEALAKSPEIRARYYQQDRDFSRGISSLTHAETLHEKAQHFGHAGVAALDFLTAVPTFHAAYDWAVTEGIPKKLGGTGAPMETADAIKFADSVVREAHGSYIESDRSNIINSRSEMVKNFTVLYTFMNNTLGQGMDAWDKAFHSEFHKPALLARTAATLAVSALAAGIVAKSPKEGHWLKWAAESLGDELAGTVPMMREAYEVVFHGWTSAGLPPWLRAVTAVGKVGKDVVTRKPVKAPIKDVGNAAGLFLPGLGQAGATAQFLYDEHTGKQRAETVEQWLRGLSRGDARTH